MSKTYSFQGSTDPSNLVPVRFFELEIASIFIGRALVRIAASSYEEAVYKLSQTPEGSEAITNAATWSYLEIQDDEDICVDNYELGREILTVDEVAALIATGKVAA